MSNNGNTLGPSKSLELAPCIQFPPILSISMIWTHLTGADRQDSA